MASNALHIAISAEELFAVGNVSVANTLFTSFVVTAVLVTFLAYAHSRLKMTAKPDRLQTLLEMIVDGLFNLITGIAGEGKKAMAFAPLISGFFVFILLNNWVELLPGFHTIIFTGEPAIKLVNVPSWMQPQPAYAVSAPAPAAQTEGGASNDRSETSAETPYASSDDESASTVKADKEEAHLSGVALLRGANADLNMTLALALISVGATQYFGLTFAGLGYLKKFFNFSDPIGAFIGILELVAEFSKIVSFAFRLFGNIFAGEVLISVISYLLPIFAPVPFIGFEIFVGALQAYVFAMLSLVFFNMAASETQH